MTHSVRCWPCKHEDWPSDPQYPYKQLKERAHTCNLSAKKAKTGGSLELSVESGKPR